MPDPSTEPSTEHDDVDATDRITVVPANEASRADLDAVFGTRGDPARCQCQYFRSSPAEWRAVPVDERTRRQRDQAACGIPEASATSGLVAYVGGEPAGWCAVEPRPAYPRLAGMRVPWAGRTEDRDDPGVWAVTCFVTRTGYRRRGVAHALARATVDHARKRGARAVEGYPVVTEPGADVSWGELFVGTRSVFESAGFAEVARPTARRVVMRVDF